MPDLHALADQVEFDEAAESHSQKRTNDGELESARSPLYYSCSDVDGIEQRVYASESEALQGGQSWDLNPVVYYRLNKPVKSTDCLPKFELDQLFARSEQDDAQISYTIQRKDVDMSEIERMQFSDEESKAKLDRLANFSTEEDNQILQQMDKQILENFVASAIESLKADCFNTEKALFKEDSSLQDVDPHVIAMRFDLLLKFNTAFDWVFKFINVKERHSSASMSNLHFMSRNLAVATVINKMVDR